MKKKPLPDGDDLALATKAAILQILRDPKAENVDKLKAMEIAA